ncbi:hypothetical protein [Brevundimonas sp.]|uniref:hypothetical protein n=1 Tax=Brevundimonas sp. TaxID=1871086 RepID=UPI002898B6A6|nr:hypothetical protein [Brevundimonas sp.]
MILPEIQKRPQRAERPSMATVRPTDLGLGAVARDVAEWEGEVQQTQLLEEEVQKLEDDKAIEPLFNALTETFEPAFSEAGASWDGVSPGFARGVTGALDAAADPLMGREDLPPGQRDALTRRIGQYKQATAQRAIQFQAQRRGQVAAEQQAARQTAAVGGVMGQYMTQMAERRAAIDNAYDGSTGDYVEQVMAAHAEVAAKVFEGVPAALQPRVQQQMEQQRMALMGQALDVGVRSEQAYLTSQSRAIGDQLINAVQTAPSMLDDALTQATAAVAGLPAGARGAALSGLQDGLIEGALGALIRDGKQDAALQRLNSGEFDTRLKPETKARLLNQAQQKSEALDVNDWMARLTLNEQIRDDLASTAATGVGVGVDLATVAAVLGPREAAEYQIALNQAKEAHQAVSGYAAMTPAEIRAQIESLKPEPGQAGFAEAQGRYEAASRAAEAEIKARTEDPAAWAVRNAPHLAGSLSALGSGDAAAARRQAGAYGLAQIELQKAAGLPLAEQRLLPKATASALVAAAQNNPDRTQGLIGLGQVVQAFAPPPGASGETIAGAMHRQTMILNELQKAGADNGDLAAALDLAGDPVRMGRYAAATRTGALEGMERKDRVALEAATDAALAPYLRSFAGMSPGTVLTGGRRAMAHRLAADALARGGSVREAAAEGAAVLTERYAYVGQNGWRMPKAMAERRSDGPGREAVQTLVQRGAGRLLASLTANDGAGFYAPADSGGRGLTEAQRRERYADAVALRGRWMTTPDDQGLVLMQPTLDGRWTAALDRSGRPIQQTWAQLQDTGRPRRPGGESVTSGRNPRGIRNHNPGNIEFRDNIRWQGQKGHDGRFVTFETPEHGLRALSRDLGTKMARGLTSVQAILTEYAPDSENDTRAYVAAVSRALGVSPTARLDPSDVRVRAGLMSAIIRHENGVHPYSPAMVAEAARQGMRR